MRQMLCFSLFILFCSIELVAQDSLKNQIEKNQLGINFGMNRMDFFTGIHYARKIDQFQIYSSIDLGVNRTFFQKRLFPRISVGGSYLFVVKRNFSIGPQISYSYSTLKVNKNTTHFHQWNELYLGSRMEIGDKIRFTNVIFGGWMNERYFNQLTNIKGGVNSMGFYFNLGISYVW